MPDRRYVDTTAVAFRSTRANRLMESKRKKRWGGLSAAGLEARHTSDTPPHQHAAVATASPSGLMAWPSTSGIAPLSLPATGRCPVGPQYLGCARADSVTPSQSLPACLPKLTCDSQPCSCLRPGPHGWPWPEATGASWPGSPARQHGSPHVYGGACASVSLAWRQIPAPTAAAAQRGQRVETVRYSGAVIPSTFCDRTIAVGGSRERRLLFLPTSTLGISKLQFMTRGKNCVSPPTHARRRGRRSARSGCTETGAHNTRQDSKARHAHYHGERQKKSCHGTPAWRLRIMCLFLLGWIRAMLWPP